MCFKCFQVLTAELNTQEPSQGLITVLAPEIKVKKVIYQGISQCEKEIKPDLPKVSKSENNKPDRKNAIGTLNAVVGQLLVYRVPEVSNGKF